jgi:membrane protease YdiL (CAAX protease family)
VRGSRRKRAAAIAIALGAGILGWTLGVTVPPPSSLQAACKAALITSAALLLISWTMTLGYPEPATRTLKLDRTPRPLPIAGLALALAGFLALSHALSRLISATGMREQSAIARIEGLLADASGGALLAAVLALALAPALGEEIFFRGLVLGRLSERWGPAAGLVGSSLLFAGLHPDWAQAAPAAVLGLCLGALTLRTGSVYAAILCHGTNNLAVIYAASSPT